MCKQDCCHDGICNKCGIQIDKEIPGCGHPIKMRCDQTPKREDCTFPCKNILSCSHMCTGTCGSCGDLNCEPCETIIEIPLACRHGGTTKVKCSASEKEMWKAKFSCQVKCDADLQCGHKCPNKCIDCFGGYIHGKCSDYCDQVLFCGHECQVRRY